MWDLIGKIANFFFKLSPDWKECQKIKQEFDGIKKELDSLREKCAIKKGLVFRDNFYWDDTNPEDRGPYCPRCADADEARSHLMGSDEKGWECKICDNCFSTSESKRQEGQALNDIGRNLEDGFNDE